MPDARTLRVARAARESGADFALLTSVDSVSYATGHAFAIEGGPSPFAGGPSLALVAGDGSSILVASNEYANEDGVYADDARFYEGWGWQRAAPLLENYLAAAKAAAATIGLGGLVAVEPRTLPFAVIDALDARVGGWVSIDRSLDRQRAVKTDAEIARLRHAAELTAVGQEAALAAARPGRAELEVFAEIRCAMEMAAGRRLPVRGDLVSGPDRSAEGLGWPSDRRLRDGDAIVCDLLVRDGGYWGDSCNGISVGEPRPEMLRMAQVVSEALAEGVTAMRPGVRADAVDAAARRVIEAAGFATPHHHMGHGVGAGSHEYPRIVPDADAELEANMVICLEPGAYVPGVGGIRLEAMFLITDAGSVAMSPFRHRLR